MFISCHSGHEIVSYEFSRSRQDGPHWESIRLVNITFLNRDSFSARIIEGALNGSIPFTDTITINGT
jgi:hypothetical protein